MKKVTRIKYQDSNNKMIVVFFNDGSICSIKKDFPLVNAETKLIKDFISNGGIIEDFRTFAQLQTAKMQTIKSNLQNYLLSYTLASGTVIKNSMQDQANNLKNIALSQQAMQANKWVASTDVTLNSVANISGVICLCTTAGKTGTAAPTPPTNFGVTVTDNTAAWKLLGFLVNTDKGRVYFTPQGILEMSQEIALILNEALTKYDTLKAQIKACTTQADLNKVVW